MSVLLKAVHVSKTLGSVTKLLANLSVSRSGIPKINAAVITRAPVQLSTSIHTTSRQDDLMEFFDHKDNWKAEHVKSGRSWKKDELRIKSNQDLHKLWFVLLKERNMLLTMEQLYTDNDTDLVSPERLDKVEESMENLEAVVRERNKAYHMLETGEDGERPGQLLYNQIGLQYYYRMTEHKIPRFMNVKWQKNNKSGFGGFAVCKFLHLYGEKRFHKKFIERRQAYGKVVRLFRLYPNVDIEAVKEKYPNVNVERAMRNAKAQGHTPPKQT